MTLFGAESFTGLLSANTPATVATGFKPFNACISADGQSVYTTNDYRLRIVNWSGWAAHYR